MVRHRVLLIVAVMLYGAACFSPALSFRVFTESPAAYKLEHLSGGALLVLGWLGLIQGQWAWLANPLLLAGWMLLLFRRPRAALAVAVLALAVACLTFTAKGQQFPHDEGDVSHMSLLRPLFGFYLWAASIALTVLAASLWPRRIPPDGTRA